MINHYFPKCTVEGECDPVSFGHLCSNGAVPRKCMFCPLFFEGVCLRGKGEYMCLDHGPCPMPSKKDGSPFPIESEKRYRGEQVRFKIPDKCEVCRYLGWDEIRLFHCRLESKIWGYFARGLDFSGIDVVDAF